MNQIAIGPEMTYQEYCAYQDAVQYGGVGPIFWWAALAFTKRDIPPDDFDDFIQLLRTHPLLSEAQR